MRACTVCEHPARAEIDAAIDAGEPGRSVARTFDLTEAAVRRHRANHVASVEAEEENVVEMEREEVPNVVPVTGGEDPTTVARRRLEAEEAAARDDRLRTLVLEEEQRRRDEWDRRGREEIRARARAEVSALADRRRALEEQFEAQMPDVLKLLDELSILDRTQRTLMATDAEMPVRAELLDELVRNRISGMLGRRWSPTIQGDRYGGMSLPERDPLAARD